MTEFVGGAWWPERRTWGNGFPQDQHLTPFQIGLGPGAGAGVRIRVAVVAQAPESGTISQVTVWPGLESGIGLYGNPGVRFWLSGVDANGLPGGPDQQVVKRFTELAIHVPLSLALTRGVSRGELVAFGMEYTADTDVLANASFALHSAQAPNTLAPQAPPWLAEYVQGTGWHVMGYPSLMPAVALHLGGNPFFLFGHVQFWWAPRIVISGAAGMHFSTPVGIDIDAIAFHFIPVSATDLVLSGPSGEIHRGTIAGGGANIIHAVTMPRTTLQPHVTYTATMEPTDTCEASAWRPGSSLADFEGGTSWTAFGSSQFTEGTERFHFYIRIPGQPILAPPQPLRPPVLTSCPPPFTPVPCVQVCPPDPPLGLVLRLRRFVPRLPVPEGPAPLPRTLEPPTLPARCTPAFTPVACPPTYPVDPPVVFVAALLARHARRAPQAGSFACAAPLGLFRLGENCLGLPVVAPGPVVPPPVVDPEGNPLIPAGATFTNPPCDQACPPDPTTALMVRAAHRHRIARAVGRRH